MEGADGTGRPVALRDGAKLPSAAGKGFAGLPGWLYAKRLHTADGRSPVPFWLPHAEVTDTRLSPGQADRRSFTFAPGTERVRVRLLYRRFWRDVAERKGWPGNDTLVAERTEDLGR